jgi:periplasmic protein TonB
MRFQLVRELLSAVAFSGWSASICIHAATLTLLCAWAADSEPELAGPMGHSSMALSVADPSPGVELEEENATDIGVALAGHEHEALAEPVSASTPLVHVDEREVEPTIKPEQAVRAAPSPDGMLAMLSADDSEKEPTEEPVPIDMKEPVDSPPELSEPPVERIADTAQSDNNKPTTDAKPSEPAKPKAAATASVPPPADLPPAAHPKLGDDTPTSSPPSMSVVGTNDRADPTFDRNAPIIYPALAIQKGYEGTVLLRVRIAADGRVADVQIVQSSGYTILDDAALESVRTRRGRPAYSAGLPIEKTALFPVVFQLH